MSCFGPFWNVILAWTLAMNNSGDENTENFKTIPCFLWVIKWVIYIRPVHLCNKCRKRSISWSDPNDEHLPREVWICGWCWCHWWWTPFCGHVWTAVIGGGHEHLFVFFSFLSRPHPLQTSIHPTAKTGPKVGFMLRCWNPTWYLEVGLVWCQGFWENVRACDSWQPEC